MCWYDGLRGVAGVAMVCGAIACGGSTKSNGTGNGDGDESGGSSPVGSGGGNGTGGSGTGEEECSRSLEDFCAWKERQGSQFRCEASSYDDVLELTQSWPIDCEVFAPEVGQTSWSYSYGSCAGGGRFISQLRASVSETYYFNSEGELVGVYLGNATGDTPCSYGTFPCQIDVIEFETCPLGGGGAGGEDS